MAGKSLSGLYLKTVKCRKLILSRDIGYGYRCATSWYDFGLTFDFTIVTLTLKSCLGYIPETIRCRKWILGRDIG